MKKALLLLLPIFAYSLEVSINTKCKAMRNHAFFSDAKVHNSCVIDDYLQEYIKCRSYYKHNMLNGLNSQGKKEEDDGIGDYTAISNYNYFNKEIKNVLEKEVKKQIAKDQSIMCIVNSEASLMKLPDPRVGVSYSSKKFYLQLYVIPFALSINLIISQFFL